jgi:hypothetical protein
MGSFHTFAQVLEQKIRREIEKDYQQAPHSSSASPSEMTFNGTHSKVETETNGKPETWSHLLGKVETVHFKETKKGDLYHRFRPAPKPRPAHVLNPDQQQAFAFFQSQFNLAANFTRADLQKAFRVLALRFHPDHGGKSHHFQSLVRARKELETIFQKA